MDLQPFQRDGYEWEDEESPSPALRGLSKPDGWTQSELVGQVKALGGRFSDTTFRDMRNAARLKPSVRGGNGQKRKYSISDLKQLIKAAEMGPFRYGKGVADAWRALLP